MEYVPCTVGIAKVTVPPVMPVAGRACVLFRYFHSMKLDELLENNATQSPVSPGPFVTVAVTEPPGAMQTTGPCTGSSSSCR